MSAMKQGTLSFTSSKRTVSAKATQKPKEVVKSVAVKIPQEAKRKEKDEDETSSASSEDTTPISQSVKAATTTAKKAGKEDVPEKEVHRENLNVNDKKWRKQYAAAREKMGHLQTIHTEGQNKVHEILRVFDMSYEYGPCIGMSRLERWQRAKALGLNPPEEIREILETKQGTEETAYSQSVLSEV